MWEVDNSNPFFQAASAAVAKPTLQTQLLQQSHEQIVAAYQTEEPEELTHQTGFNPFRNFTTNLNNLYALSLQQPPQPEALAKQAVRPQQTEQSLFEKNMTQTFSPVLGQNKTQKTEERRPTATATKKETTILDGLFAFSALQAYTAAKDSPVEDIFSLPPAPQPPSPFDFLAAAGM